MKSPRKSPQEGFLGQKIIQNHPKTQPITQKTRPKMTSRNSSKKPRTQITFRSSKIPQKTPKPKPRLVMSFVVHTRNLLLRSPQISSGRAACGSAKGRAEDQGRKEAEDEKVRHGAKHLGGTKRKEEEIKRRSRKRRRRRRMF